MFQPVLHRETLFNFRDFLFAFFFGGGEGGAYGEWPIFERKNLFQEDEFCSCNVCWIEFFGHFSHVV